MGFFARIARVHSRSSAASNARRFGTPWFRHPTAIESLAQHKPFLTANVTEFVLDDYLRRSEVSTHDARVTVILDADMMAHERLNFHPLVNTRTTGLKSVDLINFLRATGHEPVIAALGQDGPAVE